MKISVVDEGQGIVQKFAAAIGAKTRGRFIDIPPEKGGGYITGFGWGPDLRMMIRYYYLHEPILLERTNELAEGQEDIVFLLTGIFPPVGEHLTPERPAIMICRHAVSAVMDMPSHTSFGSVTIAAARKYLQQVFGHIDHPLVVSMLSADTNLVIEIDVSPGIIAVASEILNLPVSESLASHFNRLKCEELLCHIITLLLKREAAPASPMHIGDIKALYAIKAHLQAHLAEPPEIAKLARHANMSQPKLRRLFKQTFGKGIFEYYQSLRMETAADLLKNKKHTVAEVGYQLGFTNLSHFARVFEQHHGSKPKKYANTAHLPAFPVATWAPSPLP